MHSPRSRRSWQGCEGGYSIPLKGPGSTLVFLPNASLVRGRVAAIRGRLRRLEGWTENRSLSPISAFPECETSQRLGSNIRDLHPSRLRETSARNGPGSKLVFLRNTSLVRGCERRKEKDHSPHIQRGGASIAFAGRASRQPSLASTRYVCCPSIARQPARFPVPEAGGLKSSWMTEPARARRAERARFSLARVPPSPRTDAEASISCAVGSPIWENRCSWRTS